MVGRFCVRLSSTRVHRGRQMPTGPWCLAQRQVLPGRSVSPGGMHGDEACARRAVSASLVPTLRRHRHVYNEEGQGQRFSLAMSHGKGLCRDC